MFGPCFVILIGKREPIALLKLFPWCFLTVSVLRPECWTAVCDCGISWLYKLIVWTSCDIQMWTNTNLSQSEYHHWPIYAYRMPCFIIWTNPCFGFKGCCVQCSHLQFHPNFNSTLCKKIVHNLIRRCVLCRLIWFCTDCRCSIKWTQDLYGFKGNRNKWKNVNCICSRCVTQHKFDENRKM